MMKKLLLCCFLAVFLSACSSEEDNAEPPTELHDFRSGLEIHEIWSESTGDNDSQQFLKLRSLVLPESIYTVSRDGDVTAYNAANGDQRWQTSLDTTISAGVGGNGEQLLVCSQEGLLYSLDGNGKEQWQIDIKDEVLSPPVIAGKLVLLRTIDGKILAYDRNNGKPSWTYKRDEPDLTLRGTSEPLVYNGDVYVGFDNGRLVSLNLVDGSPVFDKAVSVPQGRTELDRIVDIDGDMAIQNGHIYSANYQGRAVSISLYSGQIDWARAMSSYTGVLVQGNTLYLSDQQDNVWALDVNNGATLWKQDKLKYRHLNRPVFYKGAIVVGDFEGYLHFLSPYDGHFIGRYQVDDAGILVPSVVTGDNLVTLSRAGRLSVITASPIKQQASQD